MLLPTILSAREALSLLPNLFQPSWWFFSHEKGRAMLWLKMQNASSYANYFRVAAVFDPTKHNLYLLVIRRDGRQQLLISLFFLMLCKTVSSTWKGKSDVRRNSGPVNQLLTFRSQQKLLWYRHRLNGPLICSSSDSQLWDQVFHWHDLQWYSVVSRKCSTIAPPLFCQSINRSRSKVHWGNFQLTLWDVRCPTPSRINDRYLPGCGVLWLWMETDRIEDWSIQTEYRSLS